MNLGERLFMLVITAKKFILFIHYVWFTHSYQIRLVVLNEELKKLQWKGRNVFTEEKFLFLEKCYFVMKKIDLVFDGIF